MMKQTANTLRTGRHVNKASQTGKCVLEEAVYQENQAAIS
jgi:hypothetical protein